MNHSTTPSPIGSSDDGAVQVEMQETIDLEGDDSIQPGNSNARTNARTIAGNIATPDARSDRRLIGQMKKTSDWLVLGCTIQLTLLMEMTRNQISIGQM